jgi:hypothetical protein
MIPVAAMPVATMPVAAIRIMTVVTAIMTVMTPVVMTMVTTMMAAVTVTGERRYWKQQSSGYCTNERALPKHLAPHFRLVVPIPQAS